MSATERFDRTRRPLAYRLARAVRHVRYGRRDGYPACCIARFTWDALRDRSTAPRGYPGCPWVPCNVLHHAPPASTPASGGEGT